MALQIQGVPPFNPNGEQTSLSQRWTKWVKGFQYFITASGITEDARKHALLLHMVGPTTQEIYETLHVDEQDDQKFNSALTALNNHFKMKKNVPFERSVFRNAKQNQGESIEQYVTRLRQLAEHCEYGNEIDNNIRDQIISSCKSTKLRKRLLTELELTLEKTIQIARMLEDVNHFNKTIETNNNSETLNRIHYSKPPNKQSSHNRTGASHNKPNNKPTNLECYRCGATGHAAHECKRSRNAICNKCNAKGHFTRMCKTKLSNIQQNGGKQPFRKRADQRHRTNNIEKEEDNQLANSNTIEDQSSSDDDICPLYNINSNCPKHEIQINDDVISIIIDSGSTTNILDESTFKKLNPLPEIRSTNTKIFPYRANHPLPLLGVIKVIVRANSKAFKMSNSMWPKETMVVF